MSSHLIESLLMQGRENAISAQKLCDIIGLSDTRHLRLLVERERQDGALILSYSGQGGGYYLPADGEQGREEMRQFCSLMLSRVSSSIQSTEFIRKALKQNPCQLDLFAPSNMKNENINHAEEKDSEQL